MRPSHIRTLVFLFVLLGFSVWAIPTAANFIIEYNWWKEVAQVNTWVSMLWYSIAPAAVGALVAFIALFVAHARGMHFHQHLALCRRGHWQVYIAKNIGGTSLVNLNRFHGCQSSFPAGVFRIVIV